MIFTPRQCCFNALNQVFSKQAYSSIVLQQMLKTVAATQEKNFITALFYGVIERSLTLDAWISHFSNHKKTLDLEVKTILKMGLYQLLYMDSIPDSAAVNESVKLCSYAKKTSAKGFVNGLLRSVIRQGKVFSQGSQDKLTQCSMVYSTPTWLIAKWQRAYGEKTTVALLEASLGRPPLMIRVNTLRTSANELTNQLLDEGVGVLAHSYLPNCLLLENVGDITTLSAFLDGLFHVQDSSSQYCARLVDVKPHMTVFDMCAAPGSKTFCVAQEMQNTGEIYAFDLHAHKIELIKKAAARLGIDNIKVTVQDASVLSSALPQADRVLCDVPCAGLGVIRRKPEIKYKNPEDFFGLFPLQQAILQNAANYVKDGGKLIYATCSLSRDENQQQIEQFLASRSDFHLEDTPDWCAPLLRGSSSCSDETQPQGENPWQCENGMMTFLPHLTGGDGFFVAVMQKQMFK